MMREMILLNGIILPYNACDNEILREAAEKMKRAGIKTGQLHFRLYKKSFDARKKDRIKSVSAVLAVGEGLWSVGDAKLREIGGTRHIEPVMEIQRGTGKLHGRPVVVGTGPAGMFCALMLAREGYAPIVIERGGCIADRVSAVDNFYRTRSLDPESNIQFGAGGAGTFSDGKLVTRISDARCAFVLRKLHEYGAPESIMTRAKPHVGTDVLRAVADNILNDIKVLGGEVRYNCRLDDIIERRDGITASTNTGDIFGGVLVLATGHSARDTYNMLTARDYRIEAKPFSVGLRIEHLQSDIDRALYGNFAGDPILGPAEYALSDTSGGRGVYTFCMCPGGEVVAAASEEGGVVVNGMSYHARAGRNANSAVAVSVRTADYGNDAQGAIEFQRRIERAAFAAGGGDYHAPVQTVGDFLSGRTVSEPRRILPTYMGGYTKVCDIAALFPGFVGDALRGGIVSLGGRLDGFDFGDAVLTGVETRTSAPVRILRGEDFLAVGKRFVYPCGEGAGYAGGITSAAVDGIRVAEAIMGKYSPVL